MSEGTNIYNSVYAAVFNANRSKRQRPIKLFKKRSFYSEKELENNKKIIAVAEKNDGDWISKIYAANGMKTKGAC